MDKKPFDENRETPRRAFLVLGMHRSGTSALAGTLACLGCKTPAHQIPKLEQNRKGFFESQPVARLNDRLLASAGLSWGDISSKVGTWLEDQVTDEMVNEGKDLLQAEFGKSQDFVLKDPRICRLFAYWSRVLRDSDTTPRVILIHRHPAEVARSLERRNGFSLAHGQLLWMTYVLDAEAASRGTPRAFTSFNRLLDDTIPELERIQDRLGCTFPNTEKDMAPEISDFLSPGLRSNVAGDASNLPEMTQTVYGILERWAEQGEDSSDHETLDRIRGILFALVPETGRPGRVADATFRALQNFGAEVGQVGNLPKVDLAGLWQALSSVKNALSAELDHIGDIVENKSAKAEVLQKNLVAAEEKNSALNDDLAQIRAELAECQRTSGYFAQALKATRQKIALLEREKSDVAQRAGYAEETNNAILESTTWRATKPLRGLVDFIRRGRSS